jgi:MaoC like domain
MASHREPSRGLTVGAHAVTWKVVARNSPAHAANPIHTDEGARAAGFPAALVAGVTVHAWLTHPVVEHWGDEWLRHGGGDVRFRRPVFDGDDVTVPARAGEGGSLVVEACVSGDPRAVFVATSPRILAPPALLPRLEPHDPFPPDANVLAAVSDLGTIDMTIADNWGPSYPAEVGDDLARYDAGDIVHPGVWIEVAHRALTRNIALPAWIHTRSRYQFFDALHPPGIEVEVRSRVVDAIVRKGRDEVRLDVQILHDGRVVLALDHEAIVRFN